MGIDDSLPGKPEHSKQSKKQDTKNNLTFFEWLSPEQQEKIKQSVLDMSPQNDIFFRSMLKVDGCAEKLFGEILEL